VTPEVSINLCCYNSEKYLRETIDSIVSQTYKDWELVVIDDGSRDSTEIIVKEYMGRDYPISYHYQENHGLGYARNQAIKRSRGRYIAFIDHDDLWMPEKLARQVRCFSQDDRVAIVITNVLQFNDKGQTALYYKQKKPVTGYVFRQVFGDNFICLSSAVIRKDALNSLSEWFDERFKHIEEAELFARIAYHWHLAYVDEPLVKNRIHRESSSFLRPDLSPKETEMMIQKFIHAYPDFEYTYKEEIAGLRYYVQYYYALCEWRQGKGYLVRKRLKPFLFKKYRSMIPFGLSIFPYSFFEFFLRFYRSKIKRVPVA